MVRAIAPTGQLSFRRSGDLTGSLDLALSSLRSDSLSSVGVLESPAAEVIGVIKDVAVDTRGWLYVLDETASDVRIYDTGLRLRERVGRAGHGPGELANPQSIALDEDGRLYVGDLSRRVHVFVAGRTGMRYERTLSLAVSPLSMCVMLDKVWVHGVNVGEQGLIHEYDLDGRPLRSFGSVYRSSSPIINYSLSRGHIACDASVGVIAYAPSGVIGEVHGYDTSGTIQWLTTIDGFLPSVITETARGFVIADSERGSHAIRSVIAAPGGRIVLQVAYHSRESRRSSASYAKLNTFVVDAASGRGVYVGDSVRQVAAMSAGLTVFTRQDPFPQVLVGLARRSAGATP